MPYHQPNSHHDDDLPSLRWVFNAPVTQETLQGLNAQPVFNDGLETALGNAVMLFLSEPIPISTAELDLVTAMACQPWSR